jgi:hypothetical protein
MTIIPFMRPRFTGTRFSEHSIPLELLAELAAFEEMVVEVAKWAFLKDNPDRKRTPRGFTDGISVQLTGVEGGSAIPVLSLVLATSTLVPTAPQEYLEKARDSIASAIHAVSIDGSVTEFLPEKSLSYFDRIGRRLREGEAMEFALPNSQQVARLTRETRRKLLFASANVQELTEEIIIRGTIPEVDQADSMFEVQLIDGRKIKAPLTAQHLDTVLEAFTGYKSTMKVVIQGIGRFSRKEKLLGVDSVEHISILDPLDLSARLEELAELKAGWLEGMGVAPSRQSLTWLSKRYESSLADNLPLPYAYPTPEGGVQLEWNFDKNEISLEIDLVQHMGQWHAIDLGTEKETERTLNLNEPTDWQWIQNQISELVGGAS